MHGSRLRIISVAMLAALMGTSASAQSSPQFGPPVPGVCLFARGEALENSALGKDIARKIREARVLVQQQVGNEKGRIEAELAGLRTNDSSRRMELFDEMNTVNRFEANANNRIEEQTAVAFRSIEPTMEAALAAVVTKRKCGLIVERSITYGWNSAMDITPAVIATMDARASGG